MSLTHRSFSGGSKEFGQPASPAKSTTSSSTMSPHSTPQKITSLAKPISKPPPKKATPPPEDDIFASMGLAAKPKFQTSRPAAQSTPASTFGAASGSAWGGMGATPASTSKSLGATKDTGPVDSFGDDWNDDDLDDLFDD